MVGPLPQTHASFLLCGFLACCLQEVHMYMHACSVCRKFHNAKQPSCLPAACSRVKKTAWCLQRWFTHPNALGSLVSAPPWP